MFFFKTKQNLCIPLQLISIQRLNNQGLSVLGPSGDVLAPPLTLNDCSLKGFPNGVAGCIRNPKTDGTGELRTALFADGDAAVVDGSGIRFLGILLGGWRVTMASSSSAKI